MLCLINTTLQIHKNADNTKIAIFKRNQMENDSRKKQNTTKPSIALIKKYRISLNNTHAYTHAHTSVSPDKLFYK